jgi:toxin secretion/phage lysis holin
MDNALSWFKVAFGVTMGLIVNALGGWDALLEVLVTLTCLDVVTGVLLAIYMRRLNSGDAWRGMMKKMGTYIIIAMVVSAEKVLMRDSLRAIAISYFIGAEMVSIIEHWGQFGLPIPEKIKSVLKELTENNGE